MTTNDVKESPQRDPGAEIWTTAVADDFRMALEEFLRKAEVQDLYFLRDGVRVLAQELMDHDVNQHVRADRYERTAERHGQRNSTRVGTIELSVPRVRDSSYFPSHIQLRKRSQQALLAVVQEAYVQAVSSRRVDDLVQASEMTEISKSQSLDCVRHSIRRLNASATANSTVPLSLAGCDLPQSAAGVNAGQKVALSHS